MRLLTFIRVVEYPAPLPSHACGQHKHEHQGGKHEHGQTPAADSGSTVINYHRPGHHASHACTRPPHDRTTAPEQRAPTASGSPHAVDKQRQTTQVRRASHPATPVVRPRRMVFSLSTAGFLVYRWVRRKGSRRAYIATEKSYLNKPFPNRNGFPR